MSYETLIHTFYTAFAAGDADAMVACYHEEIIFEDPAFGVLEGERAGAMWRLLLSRRTDATEITFGEITVNGNHGQVDWTAKYVYGPKKRKVVNHIQAKFQFKDGKIYRHTDSFNLWNWTKQALGPVGLLLGWTPFIKRKIRSMVLQKLDAFMKAA